MTTKLTVLSAVLFSLVLSGCGQPAQDDADIDTPRYSADYVDDAEQREQQAITEAGDNGEAPDMRAEDLIAGLQSGEIDIDTLHAGFRAETVLDMIRQQLRPARASSPEQCQVIAVGAKACGGPERYMMYSTQTTDEAALQTLVRGYNSIREYENERDGMVSDCQVVERPGVVLQNGMCRFIEQAEY